MLIIHDVTLTFVIMSELHHFTSWITSVVYFLHAHLCTNDFKYSFWFFSCTSLYEWISIFFWIFVMYYSVPMTLNSLLDFCHTLLCMNDYPYSFRFSSCTSLYEWLSILYLYGFSSCTSLYEWLFILFLYGFSSCTFLYKWLSIFIWVFRHVHLFTNGYFVPNLFPMRLC